MSITPRGAITLLGGVVLLAGCTGPGTSATTDADPRDDPATPPPALTEPLPYPLGEEALWTAPFSSEPKAAGSSFVGLVQEGEGDLRFLGVDQEGRTRWSTERDPECTGFTVTRSPAEEAELVVLLDKERDPDGGFLATRTSASAYDPGTGELVWGPTEVPGTLVGPGLVFAAAQGSVMSEETGPKVALNAATGEVAADEQQDGDAVLHEHHGNLLVHRDGAFRALGPDGEDLWTHRELDTPPEVDTESVRVRYGPRPASDSGAAVVLEWVTDADGDTEPDESDETLLLLYTVNDLRTGERLLTLSPSYEPDLLGDDQGRTVALALPVDGDDPRIYAMAATDPSPLWELPATTEEDLRTLAGGVVYTTDSEEAHRAIDADTGDVDQAQGSEDSDLVPVAALDEGPAIVSVPDEDEGHVLAAVPVV